MVNKRIGLFFGSFNPIHNGHLMIANYITEFENIDQIWFVISPLNPFKQKENLLPDYHRRELLTRAISDYVKFKVSTVEFQLPKPSYTIDTLDFLKNKYADYQFIIIMGSDQLPAFHLWKNADEILTNYTIMVYPRPEEVTHSVATWNHDLLKSSSIRFVNKAPLLEISSSFIRSAIKGGKDVRFFMPESTWQYLDEMHFYS